MDIIFSNQILTLCVLILGYVVFFRVSGDVKFLHEKIKKLENEVKNLKNKL